MAEDICTKGFHAIAIDLFNGSVAANQDEAKTQSKAVNASEANAAIATWVGQWQSYHAWLVFWRWLALFKKALSKLAKAI